MINIHLCLVGIHISLVGSALLIESQIAGHSPGPISWLMLIGGLILTLFSVLNQLFPVPTGSDT
ncbi:hypothetical protein C483_18930 [Natrialba hulunbeirensis JCM 10989]|uniref:Uncharacterized protein n=1 Tax=Natrialba hulunbeirensis JCM 10989 TaxID=1227493 RepID=L9ZJL5_9EURY|nr:hypothetical protein C483_18930 [Natrialba hulunbeirensis JCM 10989]